MAEEKQTPEAEVIDDTLTKDDNDILRYVLKNTRGIAAASVYNQAAMLEEDLDLE